MKVLYICTHNRCRSILAEAITRHVGDGVLIARSGGSNPVQAV
ncbi:MAG: arsenate reductase ArsC, partial [Halioglobus sp.]|nr:arsenate reductase ArsC [Halioglobus sp.]